MGDSSKKMANFTKLAREIDNFKIATFSHPSSIAIFLLTCAMCTINLQKKLKFLYSEKATKFCEIFTLLLSYVVPVKFKVKISQNFVAFSEYMNFNCGSHPVPNCWKVCKFFLLLSDGNGSKTPQSSISVKA